MVVIVVGIVICIQSFKQNKLLRINSILSRFLWVSYAGRDYKEYNKGDTSMDDEFREKNADLARQLVNSTSRPVGRTSATEREAITSDRFAFWLSDDVIVNPFDIMAVEQMNQPGQTPSRTYGLVTTLEHRTDAPNHLANYISSNFGQLDEEPNSIRQGTTVASAHVLNNTADIYMPVPSERIVSFAQPEDIQQALGTDLLLKERQQDAIPAGLIKMSNGAAA